MATGTYYTSEKLGPKRSLTPEGFLLCEEVPIARSGMMIYGPKETPIKAGPDGIVRIFRENEDIHRPETVASAQAKSVTYNHPDDDVTPATWNELSVGVMINVRPGVGIMDDLLLADLMITNPDAIVAVQKGIREEVSLGYEADYEETKPGVGRQTNIVINHVALVENGRCGPRCAIGDQKTVTDNGRAIMTVKKRSGFADYLLRAFKAKDAEELKQIEKEVNDEGLGEGINAEPNDLHIHVNSEGDNRASFTNDDIQEYMDQNAAEHAEMFRRIEALESQLADQRPGASEDDLDPDLMKQMEDEYPEGVEEEAAKAKDSSYLRDSFRDTVALAEILVPGIKIPTYDAEAAPQRTFKRICSLRRKALDKAYGNPLTRGLIDQVLAGRTLDTKNMSCDAVRTLFRSAAALQSAANNTHARGTGHAHDSALSAQKAAEKLTLAELNRRNAQRYAK